METFSYLCDHFFLVSFPGIFSSWILVFNGILSYALISSYIVHFPEIMLSTCIVSFIIYTVITPGSDISAELQIHKTSCLLYVRWLSILQITHMIRNKIIFSHEIAISPDVFNTNLWHYQLLSLPSWKLGNHAYMFYKNSIQVSQTNDQNSCQISGPAF